MNNEEIKEILQKIRNVANRETASRNALMEMKDKDYQLLLDYITNLQEELEDLKEEEWAWHQTLKAQNKREYRSKFLKEFQKEYNTSTFPDYDEIYKRYDKLLQENERLQQIEKDHQKLNGELREENDKLLNQLEEKEFDEAEIRADVLLEQVDYKSKCEEALDKLYCYGEVFDSKILQQFQKEMENILGDENEKDI